MVQLVVRRTCDQEVVGSTAAMSASAWTYCSQPCTPVKNQAYSEYKHVLANILRSLFVARTPSEEARSPGRRSNVENAPVDGQSPASQPRPPTIYAAQF